MSVSIDKNKLEKLEKLEVMLELMQNNGIEGYTVFLADVKATLKQLQDATKRYATLEAAERFLQEAKNVLKSAKEESAKIRADLETEKKSVVDKKQELNKLVSEKTIDLHKKEVVLKIREDAVTLEQTQLVEQKTLLESQNADAVKNLDQRHQEISKREQAMNTKEDVLKKLFGF